MTQEEKNLLHKDLCSRLPYGVKVNVAPVPHKDYKHIFFNAKIVCIDVDYIGVLSDNGFLLQQDITEIKPYLFPLSSMTEEQKEELEDMNLSFDGSVINNIIEYLGNHRQFVTHFDCSALIDWLNKNHFDYRGLIPLGLAIDATGLNVY